MEKFKEEIIRYEENSNLSSILSCMFPRFDKGMLSVLDGWTFPKFINSTKSTFLDLGFSESQSEKLYLLVLFQKKIGNMESAIKQIGSPDNAYQALKFLENETQEHFVVLALSTKNEVINKKVIFKGSLDTSIVHPREVFNFAVSERASSIIVGHNHPSGDSMASQEDIRLTERLYKSSLIIGIELLDHIIVGKNNYTSLKESGVFKTF